MMKFWRSFSDPQITQITQKQMEQLSVLSLILLEIAEIDINIIDIADCILAAHSSPGKVVVSFDKDMKKLKAVSARINTT